MSSLNDDRTSAPPSHVFEYSTFSITNKNKKKFFLWNTQMIQLAATINSRIGSVLSSSSPSEKRPFACPLSLVVLGGVAVAVVTSDHEQLAIDALAAPSTLLTVLPMCTTSSADTESSVRDAVEGFIATRCIVVQDIDALRTLEAAYPRWASISLNIIDSTDASLCDHHVLVVDTAPTSTTAPVGARVQFGATPAKTIDSAVAPSLDASRPFEAAVKDAFGEGLASVEIIVASAWQLDVSQAAVDAAAQVVMAPAPMCVASVMDGVRTALDASAALIGKARHGPAPSTLCCCWPDETLLPVVLDSSNEPARRKLHRALCLPNRPLLTTSNNISGVSWSTRTRRDTCAVTVPRRGAAWERGLIASPHLTISKSVVIENSVTAVVEGAYDYYHYRVDGFQDDGWGCAYRSLQSVVSWFQHQQLTRALVPSVLEIQKILARVDYGKESQPNFVGSREWIGSYEVMMVLTDLVPQVECTLKRLESGTQLAEDVDVQRTLLEHFRSGGAPVMIGGSSYAHTIIGIDVNVRTNEVQYLILDPHYSSNTTDMKVVKNKGWCGWKNPTKFFEAKAFYNLCIPRVQRADFS